MKKNIAAFFDIDGTLYREGLITEVFKKMIKYEIINQKNGIMTLDKILKSGIEDKEIMIHIY